MPKPSVTAKDREREFSKYGLYASDSRTIMCKFCSVTVSWDRKDACMKHIGSEKHKRLSSLNAARTKHQSSVDTLLNTCKKKRDATYEFARDTTEAFIKASIPLEKVDDPNIRAWMTKYMEGAGDLPHARTLREKYVGELAAAWMEEVKSKVEGKETNILWDEARRRILNTDLTNSLAVSEAGKTPDNKHHNTDKMNGTEKWSFRYFIFCIICHLAWSIW